MRVKRLFPRLYIILILAFIYLPMLFVIVYSFNASKTSAVWGGFTLSWYAELMRDEDIMKSLYNSLYVAVLTTLLSAVLGTLGAVGFQHMPRRLKGAFTALMYAPLILPEIILALALMSSFSLTPISYGPMTLVLSHSIFCIPYVYMMTGIRLRDMDPSLAEAARDLGASGGRAFFTVTFPLIAPSIASGALLAFAMSMDDVIISAFLSGPTSQTLPTRVYSMLKLGVTPEINALCAIMLAVVFMASLVIQFSSSRGGGKS